MIKDRLPPHSPENEQGVLGCILLDPQQSMAICVERGLAPESFYDLRHRFIYAEVLAMYEAQKPIDFITLQQQMKDKGLLEQVGGIAYLSSLPDTVPSAANLAYYLTTVEDKATLRKLIRTCTEAVGLAYEHNGEVSALMDEVEAEVMKVRRVARVEQPTIKELVRAALQTIQKRWESNGALEGLSYGLSDLDRVTGGMKPQQMIVIAARPGYGKSTLSMNFATHVCLNLNEPVGVFTLEMSSENWVERIISAEAGLNMSAVSDGFLTERDFPRITRVAGRLAASKFYIDETGGMTIQQLRAKARRMVQKHGVKLFVIDYLQLLRSSKRTDSRQVEISDVSNNIKAMAKELNVPVVVLAQLNRDIEKDKNRKPRLSDLRESGSIEADADLVGMLYNPGGTEAEGDGDSIPVNLLIAKQRNGKAPFDIHLIFRKNITKFEQASHIQE